MSKKFRNSFGQETDEQPQVEISEPSDVKSDTMIERKWHEKFRSYYDFHKTKFIGKVEHKTDMYYNYSI